MEARLWVGKTSQWESLSCTSTLAAWHRWGVTRRWLISDSPRYAGCWLLVLMFTLAIQFNSITFCNRLGEHGMTHESWFLTLWLMFGRMPGAFHMQGSSAGSSGAQPTWLVSWVGGTAFTWLSTGLPRWSLVETTRASVELSWTLWPKPNVLHASRITHFLDSVKAFQFNLDFAALSYKYGWSVHINYYWPARWNHTLGKINCHYHSCLYVQTILFFLFFYFFIFIFMFFCSGYFEPSHSNWINS